MNISIEKPTAVSAVITLKMEKADYEQQLTESLKKFARKAQMPGFRPGKVPMGLVKKLYGPQAKLEEVNKLLSEKLFGYIREEKLNMLGEPLPHEEQEPQDIEHQDDFTFRFDLALAPEFTIDLTAKDKVVYYDIDVADEQVDRQVASMRNQMGHHEEAEAYAQGDILRGLLAELGEDGMPLEEGGIRVEQASLMPNYFKSEEQQKLFADAHKNDVLTFNPTTAYEGNESELAALLKVKREDVARHAGEFSFQVEEISRYVPAELNQEFFDAVYGKDGGVKSEEDFRAKVREQIQRQHEADADYRFLIDLRAYAEKKVGDLEFPKAELRRLMLSNNKDKGEKYVDEHFDKSIEELRWHLIRERLAQTHGIKVEEQDLRQAAISATRFQFAQYGMNNIPDEYLEQYASEMLKKQEQVNQLAERVIDQKLTAALKNVVKLTRKRISVEDFQKLFEA
ncbi:MAG: trigger factor [Alloprevotella sp.]|nr:trigger factor [Alloprevotella sp.]